MNLKLSRLPILAALLVAATATVVSAQTPLIQNADLQATKDGTWPDHWPKGPASYLTEPDSDNRFLRIDSGGPDKLVLFYRTFDLPAGTTALDLAFKARVTDLQRGAQQWHDARIMMNFKDAEGKKTAAKGIPYFGKSTDGWVERTATIAVPEASVSVEFMPAMFNTTAGTFDIDDIQLTAR